MEGGINTCSPARLLHSVPWVICVVSYRSGQTQSNIRGSGAAGQQGVKHTISMVYAGLQAREEGRLTAIDWLPAKVFYCAIGLLITCLPSQSFQKLMICLAVLFLMVRQWLALVANWPAGVIQELVSRPPQLTASQLLRLLLETQQISGKAWHNTLILLNKMAKNIEDSMTIL